MKYLLSFSFLIFYVSSFSQIGNIKAISHTISGEDYDLYDMDNDGDLDVIGFENNNPFTGVPPRVLWFENIGGTFPNHARTIIDSVGYFGHSISVADMDNDGDGDVLFSDAYFNLYWCENDGGGFFKRHFIINDPTIITQIETMDVDNDNDLDIVLFDGAIMYIENISPGVFGSMTAIGLADGEFMIKDVNNDNNFDVVCVRNSLAGYYEGNGNGIFQIFQNLLSTSNFTNDIDMVDIDGDLDLDLLQISATDSIRVYENVGGIYTNMTFVDDYLYAFWDGKFIDVDNDNDFDIISSNFYGEIFFNENLGGTYASKTVLKNNIFAKKMSIVDLNLDNNDDLVYRATSTESGIFALENTGTSLSLDFRIGSKMSETDEIFIMDMDGDTDVDIITTRANQYEQPPLSWYENLGSGFFSTYKSIGSSMFYKKAIFADLDGDGLPDLIKSHFRITPSAYFRLSWEKNLGGGNFGPPVHLHDTTGGHAYDELGVYDLDGDNDLDVLASRDGMALHLFENLGGGTFAPYKIIAPTGINHCKFADLDGDLDVDIVIGYFYRIGAGWYENLGSLTFNPMDILYQSPNNSVNHSVEVDDIDNDGDNDVVSVGFSPSELWVGLNDGVGNFTGTKIDSTLDNNHDVKIVDINGDFLKDIVVVCGDPARIGWKENLGNGIFGPFNLVVGTNVGLTLDAFNRINVSDLDGDADPDFVCGTYKTNNHTLILENFFRGSFQFNGYVFYDKNQNGIKDSSDYGLNSVPVTIQPSPLTSYADHNGYYFFATDTGASVISHSLSTSWQLTTDSLIFNRALTGSIPVISGLDFGYYPSVFQTELSPEITGGFPRCNSSVNYWLNWKNNGTTEPNGKIHLELDQNINFLSANITPDSIIGQNIYWHYDSLKFFGVEQVNIQVQMPSVTFIGDTLSSYLTVHEIDGFGNSIYQVVDTLKQILVCSYDPNDKAVDPLGYYKEHFISDNQKLEYLIRFQNTGNDTAIDVMLRDRLDTNLDWNSLEILSSSDSMTHWLEPDGEMVFKYTNIMLPDSGADFIESQGYVKFRISPKTGLNPLTRIYNKCDIYFDLNQAVITNYVFNTIECNSVAMPVISFVNPYLSAGVTGNYTYEWYYNDTLIFGAFSDTLTPIQAGNYHVIVSDSTGCYRISEIFNYVPTGLNELVNNKHHVKVYPNPFEDYTTIEISDDLLGYDLTIIDLLGRKVYESQSLKTNKILINSRELFKGVFIPILRSNSTKETIYFGKIIVQ